MQNQALLKRAVDRIKEDHAALSPEAVICLILIISNPGQTVGKIAVAAGLTEPLAYRFIAELQKLDLVSLANVGNGANEVTLSAKGEELAEQVNAAILEGGG